MSARWFGTLSAVRRFLWEGGKLGFNRKKVFNEITKELRHDGEWRAVAAHSGSAHSGRRGRHSDMASGET